MQSVKLQEEERQRVKWRDWQYGVRLIIVDIRVSRLGKGIMGFPGREGLACPSVFTG